MNLLKTLFTDEKGQGMPEYGLILAMIAVGVMAALIAFRDHLSAMFSDLSAELLGAATDGG